VRPSDDSINRDGTHSPRWLPTREDAAGIGDRKTKSPTWSSCQRPVAAYVQGARLCGNNEHATSPARGKRLITMTAYRYRNDTPPNDVPLRTRFPERASW